MDAKALASGTKKAMVYVIIVITQLIALQRVIAPGVFPMRDESNYMGLAQQFNLGAGKLTGVANSPAYILLYSIFVRLFGTVNSVLYMRYFLALSVSLMLFAFLVRYLRFYIPALVFSFFWIVSICNLRIQIMVYHFGALVFLLTLIYCNSDRLLATLLLLICTLIRLEYIFIFVPYVIYSAVSYKSTTKNASASVSRRSFHRALAKYAVVVILLGVVLLNITDWNMGTRKIWFAFRQHYALAQFKMGHSSVDPWLDFNIVVERDFPMSKTLPDAFFINPGAFISHVLGNLVNVYRAAEFVFPIAFSNFYAQHNRAIAIICIVFLTGICIAFARSKDLFAALRNSCATLGDINTLALLSPLAVIPSMIVYAKSSYLLMCMPLFILYGAIILMILLKCFVHNVYFRQCLYIGSLVFIFMLKIPYPFHSKDEDYISHGAISELKDICSARRIKLLGVDSTSYCNYVGYERCFPIEALVTVEGKDLSSKAVNLKDLLTSYRPDAVLVSPSLLNSNNFDKDSLGILNTEQWGVRNIGDGKKIFLLRDTS